MNKGKTKTLIVYCNAHYALRQGQYMPIAAMAIPINGKTKRYSSNGNAPYNKGNADQGNRKGKEIDTYA